MKQTTVDVHPRFAVGEVSPLIFGGFLEHMGRCVYEGVYEPGSRHADDDGFRDDVLAALRELQMTVMRYPGGNFASGYHWRDGVGPRGDRPVVKDLAWQSLESNQFGTDEFIKLCTKMNWEPMVAVNLGTGTPEEARDWVEYCNSSAPSRFARLRAENGAAEPYGVKYWCLGNEMDGPWQLGHVPASQYAIRAQQAAKMMKDCDRSIRNVVCGSSAVTMPTYLDWDRQVLEYVGGLAHYVSLHRYVGNPDGNAEDYLAIGNSIDEQIESVDACCRYVQAKLGRQRRAYLCFDEWNVWYKARTESDMDGQDKFAPHLVEEIYNAEDALVVAQFLNSFIRHADVVKIANLAQIVNVIAPLMTRGDRLLKQSIFYAFQLFSEKKTGLSLRLAVDGPGYTTDRYREVSYLDCSAILNHRAGELTFFMVNRSPGESLPIAVNLHDLMIDSVADQRILHHDKLDAVNTFEQPEEVVPRSFDQVSINGDTFTAALPAASLLRLVLKLH
ncbi:MAG: alpha-N-arabinofuranosidase [Gammaproteobacteria bacterium]|nr:alpha-N-arabinofuranosidase [Gammaproteobacteria bacterium]